MLNSLQMALCDTQGQLFELAAERGYASEAFVKAYMTSAVAADMDKEFHHIQWAGKAYILSRMEDELADQLVKVGEIYDKEALYWMGYIYRYWHFYTGENSREIYKQAPAKTMNVVYLMYHTMSPEMAIDRLKEAYEKANGGKITVEVQQSDSTTGITSAAEGICDIGMASRELKDEETKENLTATEIARDGIAVVVNNDNDIDELTSDQVKAIFTGETTDWEDLAK